MAGAPPVCGDCGSPVGGGWGGPVCPGCGPLEPAGVQPEGGDGGAGPPGAFGEFASTFKEWHYLVGGLAVGALLTLAAALVVVWRWLGGRAGGGG